MARTRTLILLLGDLAARADQPTFTTTSFITKAEATEYINQAIAELQDLLIINNAAQYFGKSQAITTVSGTDSYALASDFYVLTNVFWNANTGTGLTRMSELSPNEDEYQITGTGWDYLARVRYELVGANLRFVPTPRGVHAVTVKYAPAPVRLSADSDTFDGYGGWEEFVLFRAAKACATKEGDTENAQIWDAEATKQAQRVLTMARRNRGEPRRVQDVTGGRFTRYGRRI